MPFTYNGNPSASTRDAVRFLIGDTDQATALLEDAEIDYIVTTEGASRVKACAAAAALAAAAKCADAALTKEVGDLSVTKARHANLLALAAKYQAEVARDAGRTAAPSVGGVSVSDKRTRMDDTDRTAPAFSRGMLDDPTNPQRGGIAASESPWST